MNKVISLAVGILFGLNTSYAQIDLGSVVKKLPVESINSGLSNDEVISGLKEALVKGTDNSVSLASSLDGYFKNDAIKIPFPKEASDMEDKLRTIGLSNEVDDFILSLNRAAEDAAKSAVPVFRDAILGMNIDDGMKILKGSDDEATQYLRSTSTTELESKFLPITKASLEKVEVTKYWTPLASTYNKIPFVKKQNPDLDAYVTNKAIEGLFFLIAQEEKKIREDPAARTTDLLKKVFGSD